MHAREIWGWHALSNGLWTLDTHAVIHESNNMKGIIGSLQLSVQHFGWTWHQMRQRKATAATGVSHSTLDKNIHELLSSTR